jgi:hypothetical protein
VRHRRDDRFNLGERAGSMISPEAAAFSSSCSGLVAPTIDDATRADMIVKGAEGKPMTYRQVG